MSNRTAKVGGLFLSRKAISLMVNWAVCSTNEAMEWFDDGGKDEVLVNSMYFPPCFIFQVSHVRLQCVGREIVYSHLL